MSTGKSNISQIVGSFGSFFERCYTSCKPDTSGNITAQNAAEFLKSSGLEESILSEIWELSDSNNKGYLNKYDFFVALKLVSLAQNKIELKLQNLHISAPCPSVNVSSPLHFTNSTISPANTWPISVEEQSRYSKIFEGLNPVNNKLSGDAVKPIFLQSKLSVQVLGQIWTLADIDTDGFLDVEEFCLAMHFIYKCLANEELPKTLPNNLVPLSKRRPASTNNFPSNSIPSTSLGSSSSIFPNSSLHGSSSSEWVIGKLEKERYDNLFFAADKDKDGFVSGIEIKDTFVQSGLPQSELAKIWDLCDINKTGLLNSEQFALAMYLINQQISSAGSKPIPSTLSFDMIPPSLRSKLGESSSNEILTLNSFGIKAESDDVYKEIEALRKERAQVEQMCRQHENDVRSQVQEVQELQNTLERTLQTAQALAAQKEEAQHRLDELSEQRNRTQVLLDETRQKCNQEREQLEILKRQIGNQTASIEEKRDELKRFQGELNDLMREETSLKDQVQKHHSKLATIEQETSSTETQIRIAEEKNISLESIKTKLQEVLEEYETFLTNPDQVKASNLPSSEVVDNLLAANGNDLEPSIEKPKPTWITDDPFQKDDPFSAIADPFGGNDPFLPVNNDPFSSQDPFSQDPFSTNNGWATTNNFSDQNAAFPIGNVDDLFSNMNSSDKSFGFKDQNHVDLTDPFGFGDSPFDSLPEKSAPPPRPTKAPLPNSSKNINSKSNFNDSIYRTVLSESDQLNWAKSESEREAKEAEDFRKREQADLELALKLSQADIKTSDRKKTGKSKK